MRSSTSLTICANFFTGRRPTAGFTFGSPGVRVGSFVGSRIVSWRSLHFFRSVFQCHSSGCASSLWPREAANCAAPGNVRWAGAGKAASGQQGPADRASHEALEGMD